MECPSCHMEMFNGKCITLGCSYYSAPQFWEELSDVVSVDDDIPIEEGNHFA